MVIMVMGVSGVGKTTIGKALAARLHWLFLDADDDHSSANIEKMHRGIPLTDADREPWLTSVGTRVRGHLDRGENVVLACSALRQQYRQQLEDVAGPMTVVFLTASHQTLEKRLAQRRHHFMNKHLLSSQIDTLEPPTGALNVDAGGTPDDVVNTIIDQIDTDTGEILAPRSPRR